jgi:ferritin
MDSHKIKYTVKRNNNFLCITTSLDKLNVSQLPPHEAFFSTLKNENISAKDYQLFQRAWQDNDMKTTKEFLTWYNNKDIEPVLEAIDKMF